jgi:hypothetical protein
VANRERVEMRTENKGDREIGLKKKKKMCKEGKRRGR